MKELNESAKEDPENAISDDLETPKFQKFSRSAPTMAVGPPNFYAPVLIYKLGCHTDSLFTFPGASNLMFNHSGLTH